METTQAPPPTVTITTATSPGLFGTNIPSSVAFLAVILLFLLPFAEIKCGGATIANQTGFGFVTKQEWKALGMLDEKDLKKDSSTNTTLESNSQIILIAVLVLALLGFIVSVANSNGMIAAVLGILGACGLLYFLFDLKSNFDASIHKDTIDQATQGSSELGNAFNNAKPSLSFAPAFWISLIVLLAAAFFSWQRKGGKSIVNSR
jgi:hypothetical protein